MIIIKWKVEDDVHEMLCSSLGFLPQCMMHRSLCQRNKKKEDLKASLIIEKKQTGMF